MADSAQSVGGTITPTGDIPFFLIDADNPQGFIAPFGSVQSLVGFEPPFNEQGGLQTAGAIEPSGEVSMVIRVDCFPAPYTCVEEPITDYDCVGACEDIVITSPPNLNLAGVIIPVGVLTFGPPPLVFEGSITPTGEVEAEIPCPSPVDEVDVVPLGAADGDFIGSVSGTPIIGAWHTEETGFGGFSLWQYKGDNTSRGAGGSGTPLGGVGYIRMHTEGSFLPPGRTTAIRQLFPGFTPGVTYTVAWKYRKINFADVVTTGVYTFTSIADGSGNLLVEYVDTPLWSGGILVGEDLWFERIPIFTATPCLDNLDGG